MRLVHVGSAACSAACRSYIMSCTVHVAALVTPAATRLYTSTLVATHASDRAWSWARAVQGRLQPCGPAGVARGQLRPIRRTRCVRRLLPPDGPAREREVCAPSCFRAVMRRSSRPPRHHTPTLCSDARSAPRPSRRTHPAPRARHVRAAAVANSLSRAPTPRTLGAIVYTCTCVLKKLNSTMCVCTIDVVPRVQCVLSAPGRRAHGG